MGIWNQNNVGWPQKAYLLITQNKKDKSRDYDRVLPQFSPEKTKHRLPHRGLSKHWLEMPLPPQYSVK